MLGHEKAIRIQDEGEMIDQHGFGSGNAIRSVSLGVRSSLRIIMKFATPLCSGFCSLTFIICLLTWSRDDDSASEWESNVHLRNWVGCELQEYRRIVRNEEEQYNKWMER
jgi:hypothetical protein